MSSSIPAQVKQYPQDLNFGPPGLALISAKAIEGKILAAHQSTSIRRKPVTTLICRAACLSDILQSVGSRADTYVRAAAGIRRRCPKIPNDSIGLMGRTNCALSGIHFEPGVVASTYPARLSSAAVAGGRPAAI